MKNERWTTLYHHKISTDAKLLQDNAHWENINGVHEKKKRKLPTDHAAEVPSLFKAESCEPLQSIKYSRVELRIFLPIYF